MAILKNKKSEGPTIPTLLAKLVAQAARLQTISKLYGDGFDSVKERIVAYLNDNTDGFVCEMSKGFKTDSATVIYQSRENWKVDADAVAKMIQSGELSLHTVLNIAKIDATKLRDCIGKDKFNAIATSSTTEYLAIKTLPDVKAKVEATVNLDIEIELPLPPKAPVAAKADPAAPAPENKAAIPQAMAELDKLLGDSN